MIEQKRVVRGVMENDINLEILNIRLKSKIYSFRDDGFVEDIHAHARKINREFGDDPLSYDQEVMEDGNLPKVGGLTRVRHNSLPPIPIISFYCHYDSLLKETFVRGHEETHVLEHIQRMDLFQEIILSGGLNINIEFYKDKELIADIGGLYAVIKSGFEPNLIIPFLDKENKDKVLEVYLEFLNSKNSVKKVN